MMSRQSGDRVGVAREGVAPVDCRRRSQDRDRADFRLDLAAIVAAAP